MGVAEPMTSATIRGASGELEILPFSGYSSCVAR
jgi:hypothetical protein